MACARTDFLGAFTIWSRFLRKGFIVGHFHYEASHIRTELCCQFLLRYRAILDNVMEQSGDYKVCIRLRKGRGHQIGDFQHMVDIRFGGGPLAFLRGVLLGGKVGGVEDGLDRFEFGGALWTGSSVHYDLSGYQPESSGIGVQYHWRSECQTT